MQHIEINIEQQKLWLKEADKTIQEFLVSTATNGAGEIMNSECTPRGEHEIAKLIGAEQVADTVFVGRVPTGEIYSPELREQHPQRDWILTRIMWLSGCEVNRNKGGQFDTYARYIYIHGTPDDVEMGEPGSHGCVRMRNEDIIHLFEFVTVGMKVIIKES